MLIIDRFEGDFAVCEDGDLFIKIDKKFLPKSAKEGTVLVKIGDEYFIDDEAENERRRVINELQDELFNNDV